MYTPMQIDAILFLAMAGCLLIGFFAEMISDALGEPEDDSEFDFIEK